MSRQISSRFTFLPKYLNPLMALVALIVLMKITRENIQLGKLPSFALPLEIALVIFLIWKTKKHTFSLMDTVEMSADSLTCRRKNDVEVIPFKNIREVEFLRHRIPLVAIHLKKPGQFGSEVRFVPPMKLFNFLRNELYEELRQKVMSRN